LREYKTVKQYIPSLHNYYLVDMVSGNDNSSGIFSGFFGKKDSKPKQAEPKKEKVKKPDKNKAKAPKEKEKKKDAEKKAVKKPEEKKENKVEKKPNNKAEKKTEEIKKEDTTEKKTEEQKPQKKIAEEKKETQSLPDNSKSPADRMPLFRTGKEDIKKQEPKTDKNENIKKAGKEEITKQEPKTDKNKSIKKTGKEKTSEKIDDDKDKKEQDKPVKKTKEGNVLLEYKINSDNVTAKVTVLEKSDEYIPIYSVEQPILHKATHAVLDHVREQVISMVQLSTSEFIDPKAYNNVKKRFMEKAMDILNEVLPESNEKDKKILVGILIHEMIGLGDIEILLNDNYLEEIVINNCEEPVWVYHKKFGWLKTTITYKSEEAIYNNMAAIGRKVGRQITNIHPLMDAHLSTGDRVNATLFPISTKGNTITIRRFSRSPWTIINLIDPKVKTLSAEIAAILWLAIQFELNILVVGGTASGKTSILNALIPFMPPNQRILSIEDTREIQLPKYLHWIPFSAREPNPEGQGGVSMLDLLANSLRMRPDRIIVGEIRRAKEAEVMFEAIRTGHSAYATFHSDTAEQAYKRLTNPPIALPEPLISALHLMLVQYRHRRKGIRRSLELAELIPLENLSNKVNVIYKWNARDDTFEKIGRYIRVLNEIHLFTGMNEIEVEENLKDKQTVLQWMLDKKIKTVNAVGKVFAEYYKNEKKIIDIAKSNKDPDDLLGPELMKEIEQGN